MAFRFQCIVTAGWTFCIDCMTAVIGFFQIQSEIGFDLVVIGFRFLAGCGHALFSFWDS